MGSRHTLARLVRAVRWTVPLVALGAVLLTLVWRQSDLAASDSALVVARVVGVVSVVGVLPLLDDPAARQVAAAPIPLYLREAPRLTAMAVLALGPVGLLTVVTNVPPGPVLLEMGSILALAAAAALLIQQLTDQTEPSTLVSVCVLVLPVAVYLLPPRFALFVPPGPNWVDAHLRWAGLAVAGTLLMTYALRDPAARRLAYLLRPRATEPGRSEDAVDSEVRST